MAVGRPTKYTKELLNKAHEYIDDYDTDGDVIPSHVGLAEYIGISTRCAYDWAKEEGKEEFSHILDEILDKQHRVLINKGLAGEFNSAIAKLVLGKHGYHDKQELSGDPKAPLIPILNVSIGNKS